MTSNMKLSEKLRILHQEKKAAYDEQHKEAMQTIRELMKKDIMPDLIERVEQEILAEAHTVSPTSKLCTIFLNNIYLFKYNVQGSTLTKTFLHEDSIQKIINLSKRFDISLFDDSFTYDVNPQNMHLEWLKDGRLTKNHAFSSIDATGLWLFEPFFTYFLEQGFESIYFRFEQSDDIRYQTLRIHLRLKEEES